MILYHGSKEKDVIPKFGLGNDNNDYGKGFYTTTEKSKACEWAVLMQEDGDGYCNEYSINLNGLKILDLDEFDVLVWVAILIRNRPPKEEALYTIGIAELFVKEFYLDTSDYDIIHGYRADDSYFAIAKSFLRGELSKSDLTKSLMLGNLGKQYCLKSKASFNNIIHIGNDIAQESIYKDAALRKDTEARKRFMEIRKEARLKIVNARRISSEGGIMDILNERGVNLENRL